MASSLVKSQKNFRRTESRNKHSWWWDSHISSKNSKWLAENLEEMDQSVKRMLKLIEEEGDSFAKKAEMYYQKRPQLVSHVEEFYRMYRSLAERYDNVTGELRKNIPSDLQSQGSGISDVGSDPTPDQHRRRSGTRAAGFDVFLKTGGSSSDLGTKEGDETSTLDSESESDDSSVNNYSSTSANSDTRGLHKRIADLEAELHKFQMQQENISRTHETTMIKNEGLEAEFSEKEQRIHTLEAELKSTREKLVDAEGEVKRLRHENGVTGWKVKVEKEKREVLKLQERITRYKGNLSEREREIRALKETLSNANKTLSEENIQLQEHVTKLLKERALLDDTIKEFDLRCQCAEEELRRIKIAKIETEGLVDQLKSEKHDLLLEVSKLEFESSLKDSRIDELDEHLNRVRMEHEELVAGVEKLRSRRDELEAEVERQREVIETGAEEKREVIRQLCFSLEHYRDGYQMLRQAFVGHNKRRPVMAS